MVSYPLQQNRFNKLDAPSHGLEDQGMPSPAPSAAGEGKAGFTGSMEVFGPVLLFIFLLFSGSAHAGVRVHSVAELTEAIAAAGRGGDPTIFLADGRYAMQGVCLRIFTDGVTIGSISGRRDRVVLDGGYQTDEIVQITASRVTLRDLTLMRARHHPIHIMGNDRGSVSGTRLVNLHVIDPGQQAVKINPVQGRTADHGLIGNCLIELTDRGRAMVTAINGSCYTGGIDAHAATGWIVRDNLIRGFWCGEGLAEHGIHFWSGSAHTLVERNLIFDCDRGIGFGLDGSPHLGGIIRNNFVVQMHGHGQSDVGIALESADGARVHNNTIFLGHDYPNAVEFRFPTTVAAQIANNLSNRPITSRDGGKALLARNLTTARAAWFVDPEHGDLHLNGPIAGVVRSGQNVPGLKDDIDRDPRPPGKAPDIGADSYSPGPGRDRFWFDRLSFSEESMNQ